MTESNIILDIIQAVGSIATAIAVIFVWRQSSQTQQELDATLRPWIGNPSVSYDDKSARLKFKFRNYGRIPAKIVSFRYKADANQPSRKDVSSGEPGAPFAGVTIYPDQERLHSYGIGTEVKSVFIGMVLDYEYANKKHKYGIIRKYEKDTDSFIIYDEWFE